MSRSGQTQEFIFRQAQEMFPQLEPEVVHMILSENDFNIAISLDQLGVLCSPLTEITTPNCSNELESMDNIGKKCLHMPSSAPNTTSHKPLSKSAKKRARKKVASNTLDQPGIPCSSSENVITKCSNGLESIESSVTPGVQIPAAAQSSTNTTSSKPLSKNAKKRARKAAAKNNRSQPLTKQAVLSEKLKNLSVDSSVQNKKHFVDKSSDISTENDSAKIQLKMNCNDLLLEKSDMRSSIQEKVPKESSNFVSEHFEDIKTFVEVVPATTPPPITEEKLPTVENSKATSAKQEFRYIMAQSYVSVGLWNGMRLQFDGDGKHQPCLVNGFNNVEHINIKFNEPDKLLSRTPRVVVNPVGFTPSAGSSFDPVELNLTLNTETCQSEVEDYEVNTNLEQKGITALKEKLNEICNKTETMKRNGWGPSRGHFQQRPWTPPRNPYHGFYSPEMVPRPRFNGGYSPMNQVHRFSRPTGKPSKEKKTLYVLRGAPGSGKSTLARQLAGSFGLILSTDDFFIKPNGYYEFDPTYLQEAHTWNQKNAIKALKQGRTPIIIDNTNMSAWEMTPYVLQGAKHSYDVQIREPNTPWKFKVGQLAKRNTHGVPKDRIELMLERYEKDVTVQGILKAARERSQHSLQFQNLLSNVQPAKPQTPKIENIDNRPSPPQISQVGQTVMDSMDNFDEEVIPEISSELYVSDTETPSGSIGEDKVDKSIDIYVSDSESDSAKDDSLITHSVNGNDFHRSYLLSETKSKDHHEHGVENVESIISTDLNHTEKIYQKTSETITNSGECLQNSPPLNPSNSDKPQTSEVNSPQLLATTNSSQNSTEQMTNIIKDTPPTSPTKKRKKKPKNSSSKPQPVLTDIHFENDWVDFLKSVETPKVSTPDTNNAHNNKNVDTKNSGSLTDPEDFVMLQQLENGADIQSTGGFKLLFANGYSFVPGSFSDIEISPSVFDKSTSTEDMIMKPDKEIDMLTLQELFPHLSVAHLLDIYTKCDDLQWATDVIAESSLFGTDENVLLDFNPRTSPISCKSPSKTIDDYYDAVSFDVIKQTTPKTAEEHVSELDETPDVCLTLPHNFLQHVAEFAGEGLPQVNTYQVQLNIDMALDIYLAWKNANSSPKLIRPPQEKELASTSKSLDKPGASLKLSNLLYDEIPFQNLQQIEEDEKLARRLQMEENHGMKAYNKSSNTPKSPATPTRRQQAVVGVSNHSLWSPRSGESPSTSSMYLPSSVGGQWVTSGKKRSDPLSKIMQEEKAAEASQKKQQSGAKTMQFAAQMKRDQLKVLYPKIPEDLLNDIFRKNEYNMEETMYEIACIWSGEDSQIFNTVTSGSLLPNANQSTKASNSNAKMNVESEGDYDPVTPTLNDHNLTYDELRSEANVHRKEMHESHRKAAAANHQNRGALAMYYASQAQLHKKYLREANNRAAAITYKLMNEGRSKNELDLHGLHVDEAIDTLRSVISMKRGEKERHLFVITGWGRNSATGTSRIKSAVTEWLKQSSIPFSKVNEGYLKISL